MISFYLRVDVSNERASNAINVLSEYDSSKIETEREGIKDRAILELKSKFACDIAASG